MREREGGGGGGRKREKCEIAEGSAPAKVEHEGFCALLRVQDGDILEPLGLVVLDFLLGGDDRELLVERDLLHRLPGLVSEAGN